MNTIKKYLRGADLFGISFTFRYKNNEKYQTALGGIINILFMILALSLGIYYFIPFFNRKNYAIVYYTMNLSKTNRVNFRESKSNFAIGLTCQGNPKEKIPFTELLSLQIRYSRYIKNPNSSFTYDRRILKTHRCTYSDFYNEYNDQFDYLGLQKYECINDNAYSIEGVYADQIFSYFDFSVQAINNSTKILDELDRFLFENDCKFNLVYTDIIINLDDYKKPITQFLNNIFIQLNPTLLVKRNMYFMNQYFYNDDYLIWNFNEDDDGGEVKTLYSRYEEYYLYKGFNRSKTYVDDFISYARIFMRADLKKTEIRRKYQKLMEFYADASSLLAALYTVLDIITSFFNNFYAYHSLAKGLFFFKELEDKNFHIFEKNKQIKELISIISKKKDENLIQKVDVSKNINNNFNFKGADGINIYNQNNKNGFKQSSSSLIFQSSIDTINVSKKSNIKILKPKNFRKNRNKFKNNKAENKTNSVSSNIRYNVQQNIEYDADGDADKTNEKKMKYYFSIFEILISQIFVCCINKKLEIKNNLNNKANDIIFQKVDIILYIRNMILFDIMNKTILDDNKKTIINFLCRPIITNNKETNNEFEEFYKNYKEENFEQLYEKLAELVQKSSKEERENRLITLTSQNLNELI